MTDDPVGDYLATLAAELRAKGIDPTTYCADRVGYWRQRALGAAQMRTHRLVAQARPPKPPSTRAPSWLARALDDYRTAASLRNYVATEARRFGRPHERDLTHGTA